MNQGQIAFNLTSSYSFAARSALPQYNYRDVFDGFDNSQELFLFQVQAEEGMLEFCYNTGGTNRQWYWVPVGTENTLFGQGVTMHVQLTWSASTVNLYLNGTLVSSTPYTVATPNWTSTSSFTFGANDPHYYGGGYYSSDDAIGAFQAQNTAVSAAPVGIVGTMQRGEFSFERFHRVHGRAERGGSRRRVQRRAGFEQRALDGAVLGDGGRWRQLGELHRYGG